MAEGATHTTQASRIQRRDRIAERYHALIPYKSQVLENGGDLKGSTQHWLAVYPPEFEIPRFVVAGY